MEMALGILCMGNVQARRKKDKSTLKNVGREMENRSILMGLGVCGFGVWIKSKMGVIKR